MAGVGSISAIGAADDPRLDNHGHDATTFPTRILDRLHDPDITIEEYLHYAKISRAEEDRLYGKNSDFVASSGPVVSFVNEKILHKKTEHRRPSQPRLSVSAQGNAQMTRTSSDNSNGEKGEKTFQPIPISDDEWLTASRAARTATW